MDTEGIARVAHEVNRAYCTSLRDYSQPPWNEAPEWQKESAINGVNLHLESPTGPESSHEDWMRHKEANGWKYGPVKDADKKEHPCMVPFNQLPPEQKAKDYIFRAVVHALAKEIPAEAQPDPLVDPDAAEGDHNSESAEPRPETATPRT